MEKLGFSGRIRPAGAADLQVVLKMVAKLADFHGDVATVTEEELARDVLGPNPWIQILLAEEAGEVVGYAALCPLAKMQFGVRGMDMHHLYVAEHRRNAGVGKALIDASLHRARSEDCRFLAVGTHPDNIIAQGIYLAMGFERLDPPGPRFGLKLESAAS